MKEYKDITKVYEAECIMEYTKWTKEIPEINFSADWNIKIIPPFGGAIVRFKIIKDVAIVSIYLDCYDSLGCYGEPYWEVYPHDGDVFRCDMKDTNCLLDAIKGSIKQQLSE